MQPQHEPAFPTACEAELCEETRHYGLTQRELFAALAMQGMLAGRGVVYQGETIASLAVRQVDDLIVELAKKPEVY